MPHFYARYQGGEAVFSLDGFCVEGSLGSRAHKLIEEWAAENQKELQILSPKAPVTFRWLIQYLQYVRQVSALD